MSRILVLLAVWSSVHSEDVCTTTEDACLLQDKSHLIKADDVLSNVLPPDCKVGCDRSDRRCALWYPWDQCTCQCVACVECPPETCDGGDSWDPCICQCISYVETVGECEEGKKNDDKIIAKTKVDCQSESIKRKRPYFTFTVPVGEKSENCKMCEKIDQDIGRAPEGSSSFSHPHLREEPAVRFD